MNSPKPKRVAFKGTLGMIRKDGANGNKFEADVVGDGDFGTVVEGLALPEGWIAVEPDGFPECFVPVHPTAIVEVDS